jgi:hypothetical protein
MQLASNKITIEAQDRTGNRIAVSLQGRLRKQKILQLLDLIELLGGVSTTASS